jgi:hypothetical protein
MPQRLLRVNALVNERRSLQSGAVAFFQKPANECGVDGSDSRQPTFCVGKDHIAIVSKRAPSWRNIVISLTKPVQEI